MKAVVIGGNGFIGSHVVDALIAAGWSVTVYDRGPERYRPSLPGVAYVKGELRDGDLLRTTLSAGDVIFHLVSTTLPQASNESIVFDIETNLVDTVRLLQVCVERRVGKVVFISSGGTVYGVPTSPPVGEEAPTLPVCSYGIVKLTIEHYLRLFQRLHGLDFTVLRPGNPYGPRQDPEGAQGAIAVFLGRIARGLPIEIWGDGEVTRDYFHVGDLASACVSAAMTGRSGEVYNIGSGQGTSLNELVAVIERTIGEPALVKRGPARACDVEAIFLDVEKAHRDLHWHARTSFAEGICDTWEWIRGLYPR